MYNNKKWDLRFLNLAKEVSTWSKDPSYGIGAIIANNKNRLVSLGYNGYPRGIKDKGMENREEKYLKVLHSEINSILFAKRDLTNCTIYVYPMPPCCRCASAIIQSGISTVITLEPTDDVYERWGKEFELSYSMYQERGINLLQYSRNVFEECCKEV